jgi:hypothetical protein
MEALRSRLTTPVQAFTFVGGGIYALAGLLGFLVTGPSGWLSDGNKALLGLDVNAFHNLFHLAAGLFLVAVTFVDPVEVAAGVSLGTGAVLLMAVGAGFANHLQILSVDGATAPDNFLHLATGAAAIFFGAVPWARQPYPASPRKV